MKRFLFFFFLLTSFGSSTLWAWFPCYRLELPGWWGTVDYLLLWRTKRFFPALVTTGPDPVLGAPGTEILFGDDRLRKSPQSGVLGDFGVWLTPCLGGGWSFFVVANEKTRFHEDNNHFPILARPFFEAGTGTPDAELIAFPALAPTGSIGIQTSNSIAGGDAYGRYEFYSTNYFQFDLLGGFMYSYLRDSLDVSTSSRNALLTITNRTDRFNAKNDYYAGLVGFVAELRTCSWAVQCIGKVGLGNMIKHVDIKGKTATMSGSTTTTFKGGLLALPSNIGNHSEGQFEALPQLYVNLQVRLWSHFWLKAGYMLLFWPDVALAGEQVDLTLNETQQDGGTLIGPSVPKFIFNDKSFTLQGFTLGLSILF